MPAAVIFDLGRGGDPAALGGQTLGLGLRLRHHRLVLGLLQALEEPQARAEQGQHDHRDCDQQSESHCSSINCHRYATLTRPQKVVTIVP